MAGTGYINFEDYLGGEPRLSAADRILQAIEGQGQAAQGAIDQAQTDYVHLPGGHHPASPTLFGFNPGRPEEFDESTPMAAIDKYRTSLDATGSVSGYAGLYAQQYAGSGSYTPGMATLDGALAAARGRFAPAVQNHYGDLYGRLQSVEPKTPAATQAAAPGDSHRHGGTSAPGLGPIPALAPAPARPAAPGLPLSPAQHNHVALPNGTGNPVPQSMIQTTGTHSPGSLDDNEPMPDYGFAPGFRNRK